MTGLRVVSVSETYSPSLYDGEFDPGSGRTLAARLIHASRATHSLGVTLGFDGAANGCVTRKEPTP